MIKRFLEWIKVKEKLDQSPSDDNLLFKEREVWWCSIRENVGNEQNGKDKDFARPVVVFKKYDRFNFLGIPLSTKIKKGSWYVEISFQDAKRVVLVNQSRSLSVKRLSNPIGTLDDVDYEKIKAGFRQLHL